MPLFWLSLAFLSGVALGFLLQWPVAVWLSLAGLALILAAFGRVLANRLPLLAARPSFLPNLSIPYSLLFVAIALGAARYQSFQPKIDLGFIAWYNDREVPYVIEGVLIEPPDARDAYTNLKVRVERLHPTDGTLFTPVEGLLLAKIPPNGDWRYGDRVRLQGILQTPFENEVFSYRDYLALQGVYSSFSCGACMSCARRAPEKCIQLLEHSQGNPVLDWLYAVKAHSLEVVYRIFPDPEASLMAGILLGVDSGIPETVQNAFRDTGTAHIIAISGFNITIVSGLFAAIFLRLLGKPRRFLAAALTAMVIAMYALLVGANAPVVRAAILGGLALFASQLGRRQNGLNSLALVAAIMVLFNPSVLWDVGFQLSFMATLGLVLYAEPMSAAFSQFAARYISTTNVQRITGPIGAYFLFTLAAQLTTLPVIIYHFQRLSLVSLVANPLILPPQPLVEILGGLALILGLVSLPLGQVAGYLAWPFVVYTIRMVELLARAPAAAIPLGKMSLPVVLLFYGLLFTWTFAGSRLGVWLSPRLGRLPPWLGSASLVVIGASTVVVWQMALSAPDGRLHLTVLDVGSGDALLIQTPTGRNLLVDGGPSPSRLSDALGRRLPLLRRKLDYLVVAATGEGQTGALPSVLERYPPDNVLWSGPPSDTYSARLLRQNLAGTQIPVAVAQAGQVLDLGAGARLEVLVAGDPGAVLLLEWENFRLLLPIGLDANSLANLLHDARLAPVSALLLAGTGSASLNPPEWIARWQPQVVLLSVGAGDVKGLPDPETVQALDGYSVLRTDQNGWIELTTDGEQMWVEVERR